MTDDHVEQTRIGLRLDRESNRTLRLGLVLYFAGVALMVALAVAKFTAGDLWRQL